MSKKLTLHDPDSLRGVDFNLGDVVLTQTFLVKAEDKIKQIHYEKDPVLYLFISLETT